MRFIYIIATITLLLGSCKSTAKLGDTSADNNYAFAFQKTESFENIKKLADTEDKLIFMDIYADWCMPCKMMDENVFSVQRLGDYYNERFISYKLNAEQGEGPSLANKYKVQVLPTLLFLDKKGKVILKYEGSAAISKMYDLADEATAKGV